VVGLYSNLLSAILLSGPTAKRVLSTNVRLMRPSLPVSSQSPGRSSRPISAGSFAVPRSTFATPVLDLILPISPHAGVEASAISDRNRSEVRVIGVPPAHYARNSMGGT